jgi:hypothetical protein
VKLVTGLAARALGAAGGVPVLVWPLLASLALASWGHWRANSLRTEVAELKLAAAQADRDAALRAEGQGRQAAAAAARYEAWRAAKEQRHADTTAALRNALGAPIPACPARVGDVLVPAAAVGVLRAAAGDAPGRAAEDAAGPGR